MLTWPAGERQHGVWAEVAQVRCMHWFMAKPAPHARSHLQFSCGHKSAISGQNISATDNPSKSGRSSVLHTAEAVIPSW